MEAGVLVKTLCKLVEVSDLRTPGKRRSRGRRVGAKRMAGYFRGNWSIENNLHWQVDVSFKEGQRRIRRWNGAENFSRLCRIALNLLKRETTNKKGIDSRRKDAGWDDEYTLKVVTA